VSYYYFTVASLPHLSYEMENPPDINDFLVICEENIKGSDLETIKSSMLDDLKRGKTGNSILDSWYNRERNLRNKLVTLRAKKQKLDPEEFLIDTPELLSGDHVTREAFEHESPLTAEDILNWERWTYLEELELGHYFDLEKLIIYYLKLQILTRKKSFNKERGTERFNEIIENISKEDFYTFKEESPLIQ
jgi:hypothetical protein